MPARDHDAASGSDAASTSRRTFLHGVCAVGGLESITRATAGSRDDGVDVSIAASPALRGITREAADHLLDGASRVTVSVDVVASTVGVDRLASGEVDLLAASRPVLPDERSRAANRGVDLDGLELPTETATLRRPDPSWLDPLRPDQLLAAWDGDGVVDTWAEVVEPATQGPAGRQPPVGGTLLVRGERAAQYAVGRGGVGYYEPPPGWLEGSSTSDDREGTSATPVVRLGFLYADRGADRSDVVSDAVSAFAERSATRVGEVEYSTDPIGGTPRDE